MQRFKVSPLLPFRSVEATGRGYHIFAASFISLPTAGSSHFSGHPFVHHLTKSFI
ncbi:MAG: hypothetical protein JXA18_12490 [Chitinispirillaceae bacterium]|nr:hypothetical protein [Chitinispirillaceae bacterium]